MKKRMLAGSVIMFSCVLLLTAGTYFEGKTTQDKDYDVNITIMRWGALDAKTDRMIGQIASADYEAVTLVFEYALNTQQVQRLTINTGTHIFDKWRALGYWSPCTYCSRHHKTGAESTRSKGATTSGGCLFKMDFPRIGNISNLRLVNVLTDGRSVNYITKFNISGNLLRSPMQVPVSRSATLHAPEYQITDVEALTPK
jgi:hypothetical protein